MLRDADTAVCKSKLAGTARYARFNEAMHEKVSHGLRLERDLRQAWAAGLLSVEYQPIFDLTKAVIGFEAFVRRDHPHPGLVQP